MNKEKNPINGMRFGKLVAISRVFDSNKNGTAYRCKCDCGNEIIVTKSHLISGDTKSCGCYARKLRSEKKTKNLMGKVYNNLFVVKRTDNKIIGGRSQVMWECKCKCGKMVIVSSNDLQTGHVKSCGCLRGEKHNHSSSRLYSIYTNMKTRCTNSNNPNYLYYGARGITICQEWQESFSSFYNWAINNGYADTLSLDRINVNGDYEPYNCRWVTELEQANNKRNNLRYTFNGETHTIAEWARLIPINKKAVYQRLERGKDISDLFECIKRHIELEG